MMRGPTPAGDDPEGLRPAELAANDRRTTRRTGVALAGVIALLAFNLRPAVTVIGPLIPELRLDLDVSGAVAGALTSLPLLAFGIVGLVTGRLARRFGLGRTVGVALALLAGGQLARAFSPDAGWLLATTVAIVVGIAVANILVPVAVRQWFPHRIGRLTGVYVMSLSASGAIAAAVAVPIASLAGSWRVGLGVWAVPAAAALAGWVIASRSARAQVPPIRKPAGRAVAVHRNPKAWALTAFFGLQAMEFYIMVGWLPAILRSAGVSASYAGVLLGVTVAIAAPMALLLPEFAARRDDQRPLVVGLVAMSATAYLGLLIAPAAAPLLWAIVLGIAGSAFPLTLLLIALRTSTARGTTDLSSLTQGVGYLFAAAGPLTFGIMHDLTGGWDAPLALLAALMVPKLIAGLIAARPGVVDRERSLPTHPSEDGEDSEDA